MLSGENKVRIGDSARKKKTVLEKKKKIRDSWKINKTIFLIICHK